MKRLAINANGNTITSFARELKESMTNRRKMVSEEIHHLEEVRRFATAVGQRKQGAWTK